MRSRSWAAPCRTYGRHFPRFNNTDNEIIVTAIYGLDTWRSAEGGKGPV
jgi:hypothetical protein